MILIVIFENSYLGVIWIFLGTVTSYCSLLGLYVCPKFKFISCQKKPVFCWWNWTSTHSNFVGDKNPLTLYV